MAVILLAVALILLVVLAHDWELVRSHRESSRGIRNHDGGLREFHYQTELSAQQVRERLEREYRVPFIQYRFDPEQSRITFYSDIPNGSTPVGYWVYVTQQGSGCTIRVVQSDHPFDRKVYALIQNESWCQLADAEPVPYEERSPLL